MDDLSIFEWHDLPLRSLAIREDGVSFTVSHWAEAEQRYESYILRLFSFDELQVAVDSVLSPADLKDMEVATFDYKRSEDGRLTGEIGILPANRGYWRITFKRASYEFIPKTD